MRISEKTGNVRIMIIINYKVITPISYYTFILTYYILF